VAASTDAGPINWISYVISVGVGLLLGVVTEPLRLWLLKPKLTALFTPDEHCLRQTPVVAIGDGHNEIHSVAKVARFLVTNERRFSAKNSRAYLTQIERRNLDGSFATVFADRLPLRWAYIGATAVDIPGKTQIYCDVAGANQAQPSLRPYTEPGAQLFNEIFDLHAVYRFTAIVTADNILPIKIQILIDWTGNWNFVDVWQEE
jgi:hypothetical protein